MDIHETAGEVKDTPILSARGRLNRHPVARVADVLKHRERTWQNDISEPLTVTITHSSELTPVSSISVATASTIIH